MHRGVLPPEATPDYHIASAPLLGLLSCSVQLTVVFTPVIFITVVGIPCEARTRIIDTRSYRVFLFLDLLDQLGIGTQSRLVVFDGPSPERVH